MTTTLQQAIKYVQRGWCVVPIPRGQKGPIIKGWQNLRLKAEELKEYFDDAGNVGIALGEPSGWLVDVDLDSELAVRLSSTYLPATVSTGRGRNPASHFWYVCDGAKTTKFQDESGMLVELRSTGCQTVVGPSIHPSGDQYDVLEGEPTKIGFDELLACVTRLAEACGWVEREANPANWITAKHVRSFGGFSGQASYGLTALQAECDKVARAVEGTRNETLNTAAFRIGQLVGGGEVEFDNAYAQLLDASRSCGLPLREAEATINSGLGAGQCSPRQRQERHAVAVDGVDLSGWGAEDADEDQGATLPPPDEELGDVQPAQDSEPFPTHLLEVPGFVADVMHHNLATAYRPQPILALAAALALQAGLAARKVQDVYKNRTNLYLIALARTNAGKEHGRSLNSEILHLAGMDYVEGPGEWASDAGLVAAVSRQPGIMFQVDELGNHLRTMREDFQDPHKMGIVTNLLKFYSVPGGVFKGKAYADADKNVTIDRPCVVIHGTSTLETFWPGLSSRDLHTGLVGRLLIFTAPDRPKGVNRPGIDIPHSIIEQAKWWGLQGQNIGNIMSGESPALEVTPGAVQGFDTLLDEADEIMRVNEGTEGEGNATVWGRAVEKARRLALVYTCSKYSMRMQEAEVDEESAQWACELVRYMTRAMLREADAWVADSQFDARQKRVLRVIEATKGKGISRKRLWDSIRSLSPRERMEVMQNLVETNQVAEMEVRKGGRGPACTTYFARRWKPKN